MKQLHQRFESRFGKSNHVQKFFCPGRVNLIGEHIDYLGGDVLPAAISLGIYAVISRNDSAIVRVHSADFSETAQFQLHELPSKSQNHWSDYILGVLIQLKNNGITVGGFDLYLESSLPKGAGLSSSAALEVLVYYALFKTFAGAEPNRTRMAQECQQVENKFIGVNCGIMDQFAVANGRNDHAIKLNCNTLEFEHVPISLNQFGLVIINSNKPRELAESAYNQRVLECEHALKDLQKHDSNLKQLVDAKIHAIELIENQLIRNRARHAVTEHQRVHLSTDALSRNDVVAFGKLMSASHASLRDDFEVSCNELDFIVSFLQQSEHCLGARMTGAGFGGCCIALIQTAAIRNLEDQLAERYSKQFGYAPTFYPCQVFDGVHELTHD